MPDQETTADTTAAEVSVEATASDSASGITKPDQNGSAPIIKDGASKAAPKVEKEVADTTEKVVEKAADKATEAIETVPAPGSEVAPKPGTATEAPAGVTGNFVFLVGLGLLALFVTYFAAEIQKRKRMIGTVLAIGVTALCVWLYSVYGMEKGIELQGGVSMQIKIESTPEKMIDADSQQQVIEVLSKRLNALGTSEVILAPSGEDGIFLQMPGVGKEKLKEIGVELEKVARLEFSILHPQSSALAGQVHSGAQVIPGYEAIPFKEEFTEDGELLPTRYGLVKYNRDMKGKYVTSANYIYGGSGHSISVSLDSEGAKIMGALSSEHLKEPMSIIMDDIILSAPTIQSTLTDNFQITGRFTQEEAQNLASALENPLENPINIEYSNFISPTMGAATVKQGILAGVAGLCLTLLFIVIYYRFSGILALLGLCISIAIIFGTMALFQFTLTLPGIAGIILTIGVAIDANVLIYERLREELAEGKSLRSAIDTAYEKAFSAIIDANITTLITAIILYSLAAGTVKGFAITLIIGIFATLFSSLLVTRVCFTWATGVGKENGFLKKVSFMNLVPDKIIDFLGKRKICLVVSVIAMVASLIIVPSVDPRGVELKGGDSITIQSTEGLSKQGIKDAVADLDLGGEPLVQQQQPVGSDGEFFLVRAPDNTAPQILAEIEKDLKVELKDTTISSVGSAVGEAMLTSSGIALLIGIVAILIYVTLRFEFAFALGAIAALFHDLIVVAGITTILGQEFTLITVGAFLTIAGYSINDTIVVFDRVREGLATKRGDVKNIMNYALNKTLARTLLTSVTTLITVTVLFLFGGPGLRNFAETLIIGVIVGTYSSIFIAAPIVLWWARKSGTNLRREVLDTEQSKIDAAGASQTGA